MFQNSKPEAKSQRSLLITRNLPPLLGGMERLNLNLARTLSNASQLTIIGPKGAGEFFGPEVQVREIAIRPLWLFLLAAARAAWQEARTRPFLVIAGSGLTAPIAKIAAWRAGARSAVYVHGLDLVAQSRIYRFLWLPFLRRLDYAWANSYSTADIAARIGVARRRISVLHPGVSLPVPNDAEGNSFREKHRLVDAKILLSVGRLTRRKGLPQFIREALPSICATHPNAVLLVIGEEALDAVDARGIGVKTEIEQAIAASGLEQHFRMLPHCDQSTLEAAYFAADVHVFPVTPAPGDIEGFGMVAIEAAAHGLPTIAFATGGVPDAVSDGVSGRLVLPGEYGDFAEEVSRTLAATGTALPAESCRKFSLQFEWGAFAKKFEQDVEMLRLGLASPSEVTRGHAPLDLASRQLKARKIELILELRSMGKPLRVLEVGTGSGGIAHYFGASKKLSCEVTSVDVVDARQTCEGYRFQIVEGAKLPFDDASFDVIISNHVIEHVGGPKLQREHLTEMARVLAPAGKGYLAVPNRWMLTEPHYRLAFLSWLPRPLRSRYLKWRRGVKVYDCEPLTTWSAERLLRDAGLRFERATGRALKCTFELECVGPQVLRRTLARLSDGTIDSVAAVIPTLVYVFFRYESGRESR